MATRLRNAVVWLPAGFAFSDLVANVHRCAGDSMAPTLHPPGDDGAAAADVVLLDRLSFRLYKYRRGEVVQLKAPDDPRQTLIRRVIGLEGDWVSIPGSSKIERVPKGHTWVEVDAPGRGDDSRTFGPVPLVLLQGRAVCVCWPPSRWGALEAALPPGRLLAMGKAAAAREGWWSQDFDDY